MKTFTRPANFVSEERTRKKGVSRYVVTCLCTGCGDVYCSSRAGIAKRKTTLCGPCEKGLPVSAEDKRKISAAVLKRYHAPQRIYPSFDPTLSPKERQKASAQRSRYWKFFRLTPEEVTRIQEYQRSHEVFRVLLGKHLGTDHCHKTGLIRGRLEFRLNKAYGLIENAYPNNTSEVLRAMALYHDNPPAIAALGEKRFGLLGKAQYKKKMVYGPPETKST